MIRFIFENFLFQNCFHFGSLLMYDSGISKKILNIKGFREALKPKKYQPKGKGGTRSPPAKSNMAARGPQNGQWGL